MHFADRSDGTALDDLHDTPIVLACVDLDPHLRRHVGGSSCQTDLTCFPHVVSQRLFAIDVFLVLERQHGRQRVRVLARADHHRIEVLRPIKQFAEVHFLAPEEIAEPR